ncbi:N-acetylmuramic acid 6-phosphate etherase [Thalassotalea sp. PS06]|nr:N-acetylmuramic acid 6-phosphate etherase [Thalassotalea sp. PS06]
MAVKYILGIDGGGTKTLGRLQQIDSGLSFDDSAGSSSLTNDFEGACIALMGLIDRLLQRSDVAPEEIAVVMGLAGAGNQSQVQRLRNRLSYSFASLEIFNDARTSLYGANLGNPVAVIALGTGSVGALLKSESEEEYAGGWGFPIGDEGSGAKLGFHAVKVLLHEIDEQRSNKSELARYIQSEIGKSQDDILNWLRNAKPAAFAKFAPHVFELAQSCPKAKSLVSKHAKDVEQLIDLTLKDETVPVVLMGGLAVPTLAFLSKPYQQKCQLTKGSSLDGACLLARQLAANETLVHTKRKVEEMDEQSLLLAQLNSMVSEERNPNTMQVDLMTSKEILERLNDEDAYVPVAVQRCIGEISDAVEMIVSAFAKGGRLVYIGAGTSGRLGILDAVECPPTFSVSHKQVIGLIAGGNDAIYKAVEGAEDSLEGAVNDLKAINFSADDVLVGIAASGRTPYVIGGLDHANSLGANTVSLTCNPGSEVSKHAKVSICPVVGPEVLTGSTRLKSGTAQKLVLNMLTTASMIRSGKSYENLMVDVNASNEKLYARAIRIVMQATNCDRETALEALNKSGYKAKLAILHVLTGVDTEQGKQLLEEQQGFLRRAVEAYQTQQAASRIAQED